MTSWYEFALCRLDTRCASHLFGAVHSRPTAWQLLARTHSGCQVEIPHTQPPKAPKHRTQRHISSQMVGNCICHPGEAQRHVPPKSKRQRTSPCEKLRWVECILCVSQCVSLVSFYLSLSLSPTIYIILFFSLSLSWFLLKLLSISFYLFLAKFVVKLRPW